MSPFTRENRSESNRNFNKPRPRSDRPDMHKATCASCGKICEVPFRPTGTKPVYCRDCFKSSDTGDTQRTENRNFRNDERQMYNAICSNCGKDCQIPFRQSQGRDVFCSRCFEKNEGSDSQRPERRTFDRPNFRQNDRQPRAETANYQVQFEQLNTKMDKILTLLTSVPKPITEEKKETIEKKVKPKKVAAAKKE